MDVHQMEQVLVNVLKNAIESIGRDGRVTISTSVAPRTLRIRDTGAGIDTDTRTRLFTPFYSTKRDGHGIGLMFVREVLVNHGFAFDLKPLDGDPGAEFTIQFE
jgi:signal transduction histidine kinase